MNEICLLPKTERILYFRTDAELADIPFEIIEKESFGFQASDDPENTLSKKK